jgi:hypothetical protein
MVHPPPLKKSERDANTSKTPHVIVGAQWNEVE